MGEISGPGYDIRPEGIAATLDAVAGAGGLILAKYDELAGFLDGAAGVAGSSGVVADALSGAGRWMDRRREEMGAVVASGIAGVDEAVAAYVAGDDEMAHHAIAGMDVIGSPPGDG
jgi:Family of unknown function (DUF6507)